jgi:hypothetical protein
MRDNTHFMDDDRSSPPREDLVLDLNFVPTWARKAPTEHPYASFDGPGGGERDRGRGGRRGDTDDRDGRGGPRRDRGGRDDRFRRRGPEAPRGEFRVPHSGAPASATAPVARPADSGPRDRGGPRRWPSAPPEPRIPAEVAFLPERQRLGAVSHRVHATCRAFPLAQIAEIFLSKAEFYLVKIELHRAHPPATGAVSGVQQFLQCAECQSVFLSREAAVRHFIGRHAEAYLEMREVAEEPPAGNFTCVARCRQSGRLLGPPNHHGFASALSETHAELFPALTVDEYRGQLEMVHDPDLIEQWKQEYSKRKVYVLKAEPESPPLRWLDARQVLESQIAPAKIRETHRVVIPASVARDIEDPAIRRLLRDAWTKEERFPLTMMIALRPALRHMGMHFFKAGGNHTFVTSVAPSAIAAERAIAPIRDTLHYLAEHPGVHRDQMAADVLGERVGEDSAKAELFGHLRWLIEKGHVIEFFDGALSVPRGRGGRDGARKEPTHAEPPDAPDATGATDATGEPPAPPPEPSAEPPAPPPATTPEPPAAP